MNEPVTPSATLDALMRKRLTAYEYEALFKPFVAALSEIPNNAPLDTSLERTRSAPSNALRKAERITPAELEHLIEWHDNCAKFSAQSDNFSGETHHEARAAALRKVDELLCDIGAGSPPSTTPQKGERVPICGTGRTGTVSRAIWDEAWIAYAKKYGGSDSQHKRLLGEGFYDSELDELRPGWRPVEQRIVELERGLADANAAAAHYVRDEPVTPRRALVRQATEIERLKGELAECHAEYKTDMATATEAIKEAERTASAMGDTQRLDALESLLWSKSLGNGLAIFPSTSNATGEKHVVLHDLGDEDGSNLGDELTELQTSLRAAIDAVLRRADGTTKAP